MDEDIWLPSHLVEQFLKERKELKEGKKSWAEYDKEIKEAHDKLIEELYDNGK